MSGPVFSSIIVNKCTVKKSSKLYAYIGTVRTTPRACTPGKILLNAFAAATPTKKPILRSYDSVNKEYLLVTLFFSRRSQSANSNKHCRVGLLNDTTPLSTKVRSVMPQPRRVRATAQPSVPAPISKHLIMLKCF